MPLLKTLLPSLALVLSASASLPTTQVQESVRLRCDPQRPLKGAVTVERVLDGDTIRVRGGRGRGRGIYTVRLTGIDTPEEYFRGESQGKWARLASRRARELIPPGTRIRLEAGKRPCDRFGRVLAQVFRAQTHVNLEMVREGLAVNYCFFPDLAYCKEFGRLAGEAIQKKKGMFADPDLELPYDFRRRVAGRRQSSFVGNLRTGAVLAPGGQDRVPVPKRVFFSSKRSVRPPFFLTD
jgi:endonuclease YncB( thermonuclease family)